MDEQYLYDPICPRSNRKPKRKILVYADGINSTPYDYSLKYTLPLAQQYTLDESLDVAHIYIRYIARKEPFSPFTFISITDSASTVFWCVGHDRVEGFPHIMNDGTVLYTHEILLVEATKLLERYYVGTKTITQPLIHDFSVTKSAKKNTSLGDINTTNPYITPINNATITIDKASTIIPLTDPNYASEMHIEVKINDITVKTYTVQESQSDQQYTLPYAGKVVISYIAYASYANYTFYYISQTSHDDYTLKDAVNMALSVAELQNESETPMFTFTDNYGFDNIESPEFTFSNRTLSEILHEIGGYAHMFPRLSITRTWNGESADVSYNIVFDKLTTTETIDKSILSGELKNASIMISGDEYCSALDCQVNNLVSRGDGGNIIAPASYAAMSFRAEDNNVSVTEETSIIHTDYPIEKIISVKIRYYDSSWSSLYDITPYIFEHDEYITLSSYDKAYPLSKQYALYYTQGRSNIYGLSFERDNVISQVFEKPAIQAIFEAASGTSISDLHYNNFQVRVEYSPIITTRFRVTKSGKSGNTVNSVIVYNQSANKIEASAFGKNAVGAVNRIGHPYIKKLYACKYLDIPTARNFVGKAFDDDYVVSEVLIEQYNSFGKIQLNLTRNYNRISQYIGVDSGIRMYDVSEKQSVDRYALYEDYCIIAPRPETNDGALATLNVAKMIKERLVSGTNYINSGIQQPHNIEYAILQGYSNGVALQRIILPVVAVGIGQSWVFSAQYLDNYGAGMGIVDTVTYNGTAYNLQQNAPYGDAYGEIDLLYMSLYDRNGSAAYMPKEAADALPIALSESGTYKFFTTGSNKRIRLNKDNREKIALTYQMHFVGSTDNYVLSPNLGSMFEIVNNKLMRGCKLVGLSTKLGKYDTSVPSSSIVWSQTITASMIGDDSYVSVNNGNITHSADCVAYAIVDNDNKLLVGENKRISATDTVPNICFNFKHKLH